MSKSGGGIPKAGDLEFAVVARDPSQEDAAPPSTLGPPPDFRVLSVFARL